jgi:hypothetical protein
MMNPRKRVNDTLYWMPQLSRHLALNRHDNALTAANA